MTKKEYILLEELKEQITLFEIAAQHLHKQAQRLRKLIWEVDLDTAEPEILHLDI
jgi:hypothetical protein